MVNTTENGSGTQEMQEFIPHEGATNGKCQIQPSSKKDAELGATTEYDPFAARDTPTATTNNEVFTHLLKASLGTGILSMPIAFKFSGIMNGVIMTIITAFISTHASGVLVKCAHKMYYRCKVDKMSFSEVSIEAFKRGPVWGRKFAGFSRIMIDGGLFLTYFGACSVYTVIVAKNLVQVLGHWDIEISVKALLTVMLIPLILISWVPNLKYLAPVSMIANLCMGTGLGITFYYLVQDLPPIQERTYFEFYTLPSFFSITIFAMAAIGVVMPLENSMKTPKSFLGIFGVLSKGMTCVTIIYMIIGFMGFWKFGDVTADSITLNLPVEEVPAQIVKLSIALAVYFTFGLQFFVCLEVVWNMVKDKCEKRPTFYNYVVRTLLVTAAVTLAILLPTIAPFIGLIGAFCFSIVGIIAPVAIEIVTDWDTGFGPYNYIMWKNVFITIFGVFALIFGSKSAIIDIMNQLGATESVQE